VLEGALVPVYRCCRQQYAQYSMMSETIAKGLRGNRRRWNMRLGNAFSTSRVLDEIEATN